MSDFDGDINKLYEIIYNFSINKSVKRHNIPYKDYFYQENGYFPTLKHAKGKIVINTRTDFE